MLCAAIGTSSASFAEILTVDDDGPADFSSLQLAVDAAFNGDEIQVAPGTYTSTDLQVVDLRGKAILLRSTGGPEVTFIDVLNSLVLDCPTRI